MDALTKQNQFGNKDLEGKKELIDQTLGAMNKSIQIDLQKVHTLITSLEKDRNPNSASLLTSLKPLPNRQPSFRKRLTAYVPRLRAPRRAGNGVNGWLKMSLGLPGS